MPTIEYESPQNRPRLNWPRRYRNSIPIAVVGYLPLVVIVALSDGPHHPANLAQRILAPIILFPIFSIFDPDSVISVLAPIFGQNCIVIVFVVNAAIAGLAVTGIWRAVTLIIQKRTG